MTTRRNASPEADLQRSVARFLDEHLPDEVMWTATAPSGWLPPQVAVRFKAHGVRRGFPDLCFIIPGRGARFCELKLTHAESSLKPEQKAVRSILQPLGHWALCTSVAEVASALMSWGVVLHKSEVWHD